MHLEFGVAAIEGQIEVYGPTNSSSDAQWCSRARAAQRNFQVRLNGAKARASLLRQMTDHTYKAGFATKFVEAARKALPGETFLALSAAAMNE